MRRGSRTAARPSVVVDLRDAEVARLELLSEALDLVFAEIPLGGRAVRPRPEPRATRRGCGSTPSRISPWAATNACTA